MAKKKEPRIDGINPKDLKQLRSAIRQVWSWSMPRKLCIAKAMHADGFPRCSNRKCPSKGEPVPKVYADHIEPCGELLSPGFIQRMYVPSKGLQALCKKCHDKKTREEKRELERAEWL